MPQHGDIDPNRPGWAWNSITGQYVPGFMLGPAQPASTGPAPIQQPAPSQQVDQGKTQSLAPDWSGVGNPNMGPFQVGDPRIDPSQTIPGQVGQRLDANGQLPGPSTGQTFQNGIPDDILQPYDGSQWQPPSVPGFDPNSIPGVTPPNFGGLPQVNNAPFEFDPSQAVNDPAYKAMADEIYRRTAATSAAGGDFASGATLKDIADNTSGLLMNQFMPFHYNTQLGQHQQNYGQSVDTYGRGLNEILAEYGSQVDTRNRGLQDWQTGYGTGVDSYNRSLGLENRDRDIFYQNQDRPFGKLTTLMGFGNNANNQIGAAGAGFGSGANSVLGNSGATLGNLALNQGDITGSGILGGYNARFDPSDYLRNIGYLGAMG
jgi:hypothetical protein